MKHNAQTYAEFPHLKYDRTPEIKLKILLCKNNYNEMFPEFFFKSKIEFCESLLEF